MTKSDLEIIKKYYEAIEKFDKDKISDDYEIIRKPTLFDGFINILDNIKYLFYNIIYGIGNLIYFFKVIWCYRWYDYAYDYQILKRMYELKERNWVQKTHYINDIKDKEHLKIIIKCLDILINEVYEGSNPERYYNGVYDILMNELRRKSRLWD